MAQWRYAIDGQAYGPVSDEVIRSLAASGTLGPMSNILPEGSSSWTPLYVHEAMLGLVRTPQNSYVIAGAEQSPGWSTPGGAVPPPPNSPGYGGALPPPGTSGPGGHAQPGYPPAGYAVYGGPGAGVIGSVGELAGWWMRVAASLLDFVIVNLPLAIVLHLAGMRMFDRTDSAGSGARFTVSGGGIVLSIAMTLLYNGVLVGVRGQTIGKQIVKIRVVDARTGTSIGAARGLLRGFVELVLNWACGVGAIVDRLFPLWDKQNQTIHDKAAGSVVIQT